MKPYLLFAGSHYYPDGGALDYKGDFDTVEEAIQNAKDGYYKDWDDEKEYKRYYDWAHVVRSSDMSIVTT